MNSSGRSFPIGAAPLDSGVNFSLFSRHASAVELLLFDGEHDIHPAELTRLHPSKNRTYYYWHTYVPGLRAGQIYAYRVDGPYDPCRGFRFDRSRVLLDPYGRSVVGGSGSSPMKSVVVDPSSYDWEGDAPLRRPSTQTIIYEMHVRGFTRHPSSGVPAAQRGTFAGVVHKIPYLQQLGVTAVELLPVFQFDAKASPPGTANYWGYAPVSFFAPHRAYSADQSRLGPTNEFRDMVKAFHRAGIEVILDVVFNHTAEGDEHGPTSCFRGIDNPTYYILEKDRSRYANYSGTGNTIRANHPAVRRMIIDSLVYWVEEMHVDGFGFDLASILARDTSGRQMSNPPVLWDIESDPRLVGTKFIAEAWDAAGLYQVGSFVGDVWKEWNGKFRDDVRNFFRGRNCTVRRIADRIIGSPDIYAHKQREAEQSINFVTCHDGFTLNDLVSYEHKHNERNGEDNRDGSNDNRSCNWGVEGPSEDVSIERLRNRQVKNYLAVTLLSLGIPMILMGDEVRRTQFGNNNAYCQDNEISWFDWHSLKTHQEILRFTSMLIERRLRRDASPERERTSLNQLLEGSRKEWHGVRLNQPDWSDDSHSIAVSAEFAKGGFFFYLALNAYWKALDFELPVLKDEGQGQWRRWIDTGLDSPHDIVDWRNAPAVTTMSYLVQPYSVIFLMSRAVSTAL
jgi:isoamylase